MSTPDDDRPVRGARPAAVARPWWRGRRAAVGAVGLIALLGGGSYVLTTQLSKPATVQKPETGAVGAVVPVPANSGDASSPRSSTSVGPSAPTTASGSPKPSKASVPDPVASASAKVEREIKKARAAAAEDGYPVIRPLPASTARPAPGQRETQKRDKQGSVRVITAKGDLTGQRELRWVADKGTPAGTARCSRKIRLSNEQAAAVVPNMLMCWRTSAAKSVVVINVRYREKPTTAATVAILDNEWTKI